ncbi:MAG TPA: hypothetical protein VIL97_09880 [Thermoanaerobaculia bacterium]
MNIHWKLYEDDADPMNPLGSITLTGADGAALAEEATFLDSWFRALLIGLHGTRQPGDEWVEQIDGPDPLHFRREADRVWLSHDLATIDLGDHDAAFSEARAQAVKFVRRFQLRAEWESNTTLVEIQKLLQR